MNNKKGNVFLLIQEKLILRNKIRDKERNFVNDKMINELERQKFRILRFCICMFLKIWFIIRYRKYKVIEYFNSGIQKFDLIDIYVILYLRSEE